MVEKVHTPLPSAASAAAKEQHYSTVIQDIKLVLQNEPDWVAAMATVSSILHNAFEYYHWTGFYCVWPHTGPDTLVIGPYQGSLGCLRIPFSRGVCGAAARSQQTQLVPDVHSFEGHIACASSTQSEVVVPVVAAAAVEGQPPEQQQQQPNGRGQLLAVLDVDSDHSAVFDELDARHLEGLCSWLAQKYAGAATQS